MLLVPRSLLAPRLSCGNKKKKHNGWSSELRNDYYYMYIFGFPIFLVLKIPYIALVLICGVWFSSRDVLSEAG